MAVNGPCYVTQRGIVSQNFVAKLPGDLYNNNYTDPMNSLIINIELTFDILNYFIKIWYIKGRFRIKFGSSHYVNYINFDRIHPRRHSVAPDAVTINSLLNDYYLYKSSSLHSTLLT